MISVISSLTPITTSIPLIGVLSLTAVKDAYDDYVSEIFLFYYYKKEIIKILIERYCQIKIIYLLHFSLYLILIVTIIGNISDFQHNSFLNRFL